MGKWNDYTTKTALKDNDELMILDKDANANKRTLLDKVWDYVVNKMTTAVITKLGTTNKTLIGAVNELNSNLQTSVDSSNVNDVRIGFSIIRWNSSTLNTSTSEKITEASCGIIISFTESNDWGVQLSMQAGNNNFCYRTKSGTWSDWKSLMK